MDFLVASANWRDYQDGTRVSVRKGIRRSVMYHLNGLKKGGFIKVP